MIIYFDFQISKWLVTWSKILSVQSRLIKFHSILLPFLPLACVLTGLRPIKFCGITWMNWMDNWTIFFCQTLKIQIKRQQFKQMLTTIFSKTIKTFVNIFSLFHLLFSVSYFMPLYKNKQIAIIRTNHRCYYLSQHVQSNKNLKKILSNRTIQLN